QQRLVVTLDGTDVGHSAVAKQDVGLPVAGRFGGGAAHGIGHTGESIGTPPSARPVPATCRPTGRMPAWHVAAPRLLSPTTSRNTSSTSTSVTRSKRPSWSTRTPSSTRAH